MDNTKGRVYMVGGSILPLMVGEMVQVSLLGISSLYTIVSNVLFISYYCSISIATRCDLTVDFACYLWGVVGVAVKFFLSILTSFAMLGISNDEHSSTF